MLDRVQKEKGFSKEHTSIAKGIAILLMVYHHLFVLPERLGNNYISVINAFGYNAQSILANFSKICVCIFVFCSGVGLYYSLIHVLSFKKMYKKVILHGLKFMLNYWVIVLFIYPIGVFLHYFDTDIHTFLNVVTASYDGIMEWWFVKLYLVLLIIAPIFIRLFQNVKPIQKVCPICVVLVVFILVKAINHVSFFENSIVLSYINWSLYIEYYYDCVLTFAVGMLCARHSIINSFQKHNGKDKWMVCVLSILFSIVIRVVLSNSPTSMNLDFLLVPMFVLPMVTLLYKTKLGLVLSFFAKHSTNIWLTHTFWCYYFGQRIVLLPRYSTLIYFWLLILSLLSSYVINLIYIPLVNLLFSKKHKLNYSDYFYFQKKDS